MSGILVIGGIILAIGALLVGIYNRLVALRQTCNQAWADVDVQLKQRYDLIPNLVNTVKGYATHEKETFEEVVAARNSAVNASGPADQAKAEGVLGMALGRLFALAEAYPDLKANTNFLQLQDQLADVENKISAARRFYNNAAQEYNTGREQFPAVLIAGMLGFQPREFFESPEGENVMSAPEVKF